MKIPTRLNEYEALTFSLDEGLSKDNLEKLKKNIQIARDTIVFMTAIARAKGLGGHTGGAYDVVPEVLILDGFMKGNKNIVPVFYDEAGHRVAIQYLMAVINGYMPKENLFKYREFKSGLYGHPEREDKKGVFFSSGRLGHLWSYVNGVTMQNPDSITVMLGSDGSQQEGDDAEAARFAASHNLNIKIIVDDNDVTITGHPTEYMPGYDLVQTFEGHGIHAVSVDGEDIATLYEEIRSALTTDGPQAIVNWRKMAVGIKGIEGTSKGHDVIPLENAFEYLTDRGLTKAVDYLKTVKKNSPEKKTYLGTSEKRSKNRDLFGKIVSQKIKEMDDYTEKIIVVDSDLAGSCGLHHIKKEVPEVYVMGGIMERNNFSVCAGFGSVEGKQGIFGTFAAFQEMLISEITMARLNKANVLAHFSHSGIDDMADNTCHFGINNFFADNGIPEDDMTRLYFPADANQLKAILDVVFEEPGLRFVYTTRSAVPDVLKENGEEFFGKGYAFIEGTDEVIREGTDGYVVTYGEMLWRVLHAVEELKKEGISIGVINKPTLNVVDEDMMKKIGCAPFVLVVESQNEKTGLGSRFGTWILERGHKTKYAHMGTHMLGKGGLSEQMTTQGLDPEEIKKKIMGLL